MLLPLLLVTHPTTLLGYVADWCVLSGQLDVFEFRERRTRLWLMAVPIGKGSLFSYELRSIREPRIVYPGDPVAYASVAASPDTALDLLPSTSPHLINLIPTLESEESDIRDPNAAPEHRIRAIIERFESCEYWCHLNRMLGPRRLILPIFTCLMLLAGAGALANLLGLPLLQIAASLGIAAWMGWLVWSALTITSHGWKAIRAPLTASLRVINPTRDELVFARRAVRGSAPQVARCASPGRLLRRIHTARQRTPSKA